MLLRKQAISSQGDRAVTLVLNCANDKAQWSHSILKAAEIIKLLNQIYLDASVFKSTQVYRWSRLWTRSTNVTRTERSTSTAHLLPWEPDNIRSARREFPWRLEAVSFRSHYDPEFHSASKIHEYYGYFLDGKGGWCVGLTTLPPSGADCQEILAASTSWSSKGLSRPVMVSEVLIRR